MKIFIGGDHRGFKLKKEITVLLKESGHTVEDVGVHEEGVICDYPSLSYAVATGVAKSKNARGILICMTGNGHVIAANKVKGAYAALCYNKQAALLSREHNNANILVLGARFTPKKDIQGIIKAWLNAKFEGGRHLRRIRQIKEIEKKTMKSQ
ncbi:MAG: ribose 5-phosphate isomerase B [Candidatus Omnitrophica bacterium]|nr:ribose 5-phosphate isomerase B [Candidatus Omnitrophota bacterium]